MWLFQEGTVALPVQTKSLYNNKCLQNSGIYNPSGPENRAPARFLLARPNVVLKGYVYPNIPFTAFQAGRQDS